jgi:hypothetical protein
MGSMIVLFALLRVFFMRDVQLLSTAPARRRLAVSIAYGALNALYPMALSALLISGLANRPLQLFHSSALWMVSVLWHCLIWATCLTLGGKGAAGRCWLVAM